MDEVITIPAAPDAPPMFRVFTPGQVAVASFIGGPMGGCWLLSRNERVFGGSRARRIVWLGFFATLGLLAVVLVLPNGGGGALAPDRIDHKIANTLSASQKKLPGHLRWGALRRS